jgi:hypothetical protein
MISLSEYKKRIGVTKTKYVMDWVNQNLIPGVIKAPDVASTLFPDSARRPYKDRGRIKATSDTSAIRVHLVHAALRREHMTREMCHLEPMEFKGIIDELVAADFIRRRTEDHITYYDSTMRSEAYQGKSFRELRQFVLDALAVMAKGAAEGAMKAYLDKAL